MAKRTGGFIGQDGINAPDPATGVTGTAGNEQVTVSWTAPSDVGGAAITGYNVQGSNGAALTLLDVYSGSYASKSFSIASQETSPKGVFFKSDGTKMYVTGQTSDYTYQYSLSTAWDVSTASYDSVSLANPAGAVTDIFFKPDGTELYFAESTNQSNIYRYTLSTAWDLSTATSTNSNTSSFTQLGNNQMIFFKSDGTKLYLGANGNASTDLYEYNLSTAWDITTSSVSYSGNTLETTAQDNEITGLFFNSDGTEFYLLGYQNDRVYIYTLSTAWDISSGSYTNYYISVGTQETQPEAVTFSPDLKNMYVVGFTNDTVYQYDVSPESYPTESPRHNNWPHQRHRSYTFNVWAINPFGWSSPSDASGGVSPYAPRALFAAGNTGSMSNVIDTVVITTLGNASDFGDLNYSAQNTYACSSVTRGIVAGGALPSPSVNNISYVTIGSTGSASDFGDLNNANTAGAGLSNSTRGIFAGGSTYRADIYYITIASTGNSSTFGSLNPAAENTASCASSTRGVWAGGNPNTGNNTISYVTIASTGDASDFGDLIVGRTEAGGASSATRALFGGAYSGDYRSIEYVTIASTGNATDFGELTYDARGNRGTSSSTRALFMGGLSSNNIDYVTISTTGNAADFGDMTISAYNRSALSNDHGGLQ